jgi:hypothetical protein
MIDNMDFIEQQALESAQNGSVPVQYIQPVKPIDPPPEVQEMLDKEAKEKGIVKEVPKIEDVHKEVDEVFDEMPDVITEVEKPIIKMESKSIIKDVPIIEKMPDIVDVRTTKRKLRYGWKIVNESSVDIYTMPPMLKKDCWKTPPDLITYTYNRFGKNGYMFDPCPADPKVNGLLIDWEEYNYVNPPYSKPEQPCKKECIKKQCKERGFHMEEYKPGQLDWVKKGIEEAQKGKHVYMLIPSDTSTKLWNDYVMKYAYMIYFIKGRIKFVGASGMPKFGNALVYFCDTCLGILDCETIDYKG